jgi:hypothetical protein
MDETDCMVDVAKYFTKFLEEESSREVRALPRGRSPDERF